MQNNIILSIDTSTEACSVALSSEEMIICEKYINTPKIHASILAPFIQQILQENLLTLNNCCAIAVSEGPGSYTGLRVGVSTAKGLCYGAKKPLISVNTLAIIAQCAIDNISDIHPDKIIPMIDARRMEVYTAVFSNTGEQLTNTEAKVLDENSFADILSINKVLFTGNGSMKFKECLKESPYLNNAIFIEQLPHASGMRKIANSSFKNSTFKDVAYFEPFYLKEFTASKPKKLL